MTLSLRHLSKAIFTAALLCAAPVLSACSKVSPNAQAIDRQQAEFKVKHVDAKEAYVLLSSAPDTVVIDIRTPDEIQQGHIDGAVFANFYDDDFTAQLSRLDKTTPYIVHCRSGGRSTKSLDAFKTLGFTNITHMDGGMKDWEANNLPLTTP